MKDATTPTFRKIYFISPLIASKGRMSSNGGIFRAMQLQQEERDGFVSFADAVRPHLRHNIYANH